MRQSAEHIDEHGHHQFDMWDGKACCIMGAPRMVAGEASYSHIIRNLLDHIGYNEKWNDEPGRTKEEVVAALYDSASKVNEQLMEAAFGPKWTDIVDIITGVDNWDQQAYTEIEQSEAERVLDWGEVPDQYYIQSMASFIATVMTSGKTSNSAPFKNYFDRKYKDLQ